jgi:hypothetical protein
MDTERVGALQAAVEAVPDSPSKRYMASETMKTRGFDPISRMIDLAEELEAKDAELKTPVNAQKRLAVYATLAKYYAPQPKSVDISVKTDNNYTIQAVSFQELIDQSRGMIPQQLGYAGPTLLGAVEEVLNDP